ncbi:hypothetical protein J2T03_003759 [Chryseobacterium lathyri]|nr:hypothetical protein [Chryseobacterium lathyri]
MNCGLRIHFQFVAVYSNSKFRKEGWDKKSQPDQVPKVYFNEVVSALASINYVFLSLRFLF